MTFDAQAVARQLLAKNDLLYDKICASLSCPWEQAEIAVREVLRFMELVAENREAGLLTPSVRVDLVWHELILFTRLYSELCEQNFGRFIHHTPSRPSHINELQYERTLEMYKRHYGPADMRFWPPPKRSSECGSCEAP